MTKHAHDWLARWAYYTPQKMFLREHASDRAWTFGQFNEAARRCAAHFQHDLNLQKGDRLAIYSRNRIEYFLLYFAAIKLGVIVVPLNFRLTPVELDVLLEDAEPIVIIFEKDYTPQIGKLTALPENCQRLELECFSGWLEPDKDKTSPDLMEAEIDSEDLVMILYTSGTTGVPNSTIKVIPKCGHFVQLDAPEAANKAITAFLK